MTPPPILEKIRAVRDKQVKELNLSHQGLSEIPSEVFELTHLEELNLRGNQISDISNEIMCLSQLRCLNLGYNSLKTLPESVRCLTRLTNLDIAGNNLTTLPDWFGGLTNLSKLDISSNKLTTLPESVGGLTNLTTLKLWGNKLTTLPESVGGLTNLISLNLSRNKLTALPESLGGLTLLTKLNLSDNNLTTLPESLGGLTHLASLHILRNNLIEVPDSVYSLHSLRKLSFANDDWYESKNQITTLSPKLLQLKNLEELYITGNPITEPSPSIVRKGLDAIRDYFRQQQEQGTVPLYAAKVLIVGEPGAGKTTLLRKLIDAEYPVPNEEQESTLGVDVHPGWEFLLPDRPEITFSANLWDFGGQQIQYLIHHFFLSSRALYVLVADDREQRTDFDYWFRIIELLGDNSPVLVVLNEKQHRSISNFDAQKYRERYAFFQELPRDVDFANIADGRFDVLRRKIQSMLANLPHVGTPLPAKWPAIQQALEDRQDENYISIADYFAICREHGITRESDQLLLSGYLHDLGLILHFRHDPGLADTIIVNPAWATRGVYQLLSDTTVEKQQGRFSRALLDKLWEQQGYTFVDRGKLLALMLKDNFELCFKLSDADGGEYLTPQLLPAVQPEFEWDGRNNLRFRYQYPFLPKGVLARLIVRISDFIHEQDGRDLIWGRGAVFHRNGALARVIEDETRREGLKVIDLAVCGGDLRQRQEFLTQICGELDIIHTRSFSRMAYTEMIPCNCDECRQSAEPTYFEHDELRQYEREGERMIKCRKGRLKNVEVQALLDGVGLTSLKHRHGRQSPKSIPHDLRQCATDLLTTLPNIETTDSFLALVLSAGLDQRLIGQLHFDKPISQIAPLTINALIAYGPLEDERHPLIAVLEAAHERVGQPRGEEIVALIEEIRPYCR